MYASDESSSRGLHHGGSTSGCRACNEPSYMVLMELSRFIAEPGSGEVLAGALAPALAILKQESGWEINPLNHL